jgi:anti-sigma-K factor RskA
MRFLIASLLFLVACASSGAHVGDATNGRAVSILTVRNQRFEDLTIYVMHDGYKGRRLGQVSSLGSATFVLDELDAPPATDLQFLAVSFSPNGGSELSDPIQIVRGESYVWKVAPGRDHQVAVHRYTT